MYSVSFLLSNLCLSIYNVHGFETLYVHKGGISLSGRTATYQGNVNLQWKWQKQVGGKQEDPGNFNFKGGDPNYSSNQPRTLLDSVSEPVNQLLRVLVGWLTASLDETTLPNPPTLQHNFQHLHDNNKLSMSQQIETRYKNTTVLWLQTSYNLTSLRSCLKKK